MKSFIGAIILICVALAGVVACNFMVGGLDDYGTTCQYEGRNETACGVCLQKCQARINAVCQPGNKVRDDGNATLLTEVSSCAKNPSMLSGTNGWGCDYFIDAGEPAPLEKDDVIKQLKWCVFSNCTRDDGAEIPPCKTCPLTHTESGKTYTLTDSVCGKCISDNCQRDVIDCCSDTFGGSSRRLAECAYPLAQKPGCLEIWNATIEKTADGGVQNTSRCMDRIQRCMKTSCSEQCAPK